MPRPPTSIPHRSASEMAAAIIKAIMLQPANTADICRRIGVSNSHAAAVDKYIKAFWDSGLVRICDWKTYSSPVWEWQASPYELKDEERPTRKYIYGKGWTDLDIPEQCKQGYDHDV